MNDESRTDSRLTALRARIEAARARTVEWLAAMRASGHPAGVLRISAAHDESLWPGVLLPGTYNGVMCADLIDALPAIGVANTAAAASLVAWLESFRRPDGVFRIPEMRDADVFKKPDRDETWRYIDFHVTNYTLGAIEALAPARAPVLDFVRPYLDPQYLKAWLADRDLRDPWQEGNNIVNLAGFLLSLERHGNDADRRAVAAALDILFDWHDRLQEPTTGFWGPASTNRRCGCCTPWRARCTIITSGTPAAACCPISTRPSPTAWDCRRASTARASTSISSTC